MPMACPAMDRTLALLASNTDMCSSVMQCNVDAMAKAAAGCPPTPSSHIRRIQSLFGAFRRTYAELLAQHPSIKLDFRHLEKTRPRRKQPFDIVLSRCHEPLMPLLRVLPAALPAGAWVRLRVVVYERCSSFEDFRVLPSFDVRDTAPTVLRIALKAVQVNAFTAYMDSLRSGEMLGHAYAGRCRPSARSQSTCPNPKPLRRSQPARIYTRTGDLDSSTVGLTDLAIAPDLAPLSEPSGLIFFIKTRMLEGLTPPWSNPVTADPVAMAAPASRRKSVEAKQEELVERLREQWGAMERVETWTKGGGTEATLIGRMLTLVQDSGILGSRGEDGRHIGFASRLDDAANRSIALLTTAGHAKQVKTWRALLRDASSTGQHNPTHAQLASSVVAGAHSVGGSSYAPSFAVARRSGVVGERPRSDAQAGFGNPVVWPANESAEGA